MKTSFRKSVAARELPPKYNALIARQPPRSEVVAQGNRWRQQYGLQELALQEEGPRAVVVARSTARQVASAVAAANDPASLGAMVREIAMEIINDPAVVRQVFQIQEDRRNRRGSSEEDPRPTQSAAAEAASVMWETRAPSWRNPEHLLIGGHAVSERQTGYRPGQIHTDFSGTSFGARGNYVAIMAAMGKLKEVTGATDAEVMTAVKAITQGGTTPASIAGNPEAGPYLARVARLWWQVEPGRNPASLVTGPMAAEVVESGTPHQTRTAETAVGGRYNPMAPQGAGVAARGAGQLVGVPVPSLARGGAATDPDAQAFLAKEHRLMVAYITTLIESKKLVFPDDAALRSFIRNGLRDYLTKEIRTLMTTVNQP